MSTLEIEKQLEIVEKICKSFSRKTHVSYDDLYGVAMEKLPIVEGNFIPSLNDNYGAFLRRSLNGYLRNYIRDHSFTVKIPRKTSEIYMKTRKYASYLIASLHTKWSEKEIREAHETVNIYRSYNTNQYKSWNTELNSLSEHNHLSDAKEICKEADVDLDILYDYFLHEMPLDKLKVKYGDNALNQIGKHTRKLKKLAVNQGYLT